jgi:hypothetical protein
MVSQEMQRFGFIRLCVLILASFMLDNGVIKAHTVEFDLDISSPSEVVAAVVGAEYGPDTNQ